MNGVYVMGYGVMEMEDTYTIRAGSTHLTLDKQSVSVFAEYETWDGKKINAGGVSHALDERQATELILWLHKTYIEKK